MPTVLVLSDNATHMTLKEITDLLEVRHDKAMLKVAKMLEEPEFGQVSIMDISYQKGNGATDTIKTYQLDKRQSIAVAARLNTKLLMRIIDRWQALEDELRAKEPDLYSPLWFKVRAEGIVARREETDAIKLFVEYARSQGSGSADKYYMALTKMQNTALFVVEGDKPKNLRDVLNWKQLSAVKTSDLVVAKAVAEGIAAGLPYKDIYQLAKQRVETLAAAVGKEKVVVAALANLMDKPKRLKATKKAANTIDSPKRKAHLIRGLDSCP